MVSQFGDGLFQAGLAGALLFNPDRAADPMAIARAFAVLFLPYSLLGPFAGALMDRWDRRLVLVGANILRLGFIAAIGVILVFEAGEVLLLCTALLANGMSRFVVAGLSAALPHVVPRNQVVTMNSVATASGAIAALAGAVLMVVKSRFDGGGDHGAAVVIFAAMVPVSVGLVLALRFAPRALGPGDSPRALRGSASYAVVTGWLHGVRAIVRVPTVAGALSALAAHRMVVGINSLLILLLAHRAEDADTAGMGTALMFVSASGLGAFLANVLTPGLVLRWGRYATTNSALLAAAATQTAGAGLLLPVMVTCGFFIGLAGQVVKLCADSAMQIDINDAMRGHVFAVQDALFWVSFIAAVTVAAVFIPPDGHAPAFALAGSVLYLIGLGVHGVVARRGGPLPTDLPGT